jgi:hypothetical protein
MMVTNTPTRRADRKPAHPAAKAMAECVVSDHPNLTWNSVSEEIRTALINQADRVIAALDVAGWLIVPNDGG